MWDVGCGSACRGDTKGKSAGRCSMFSTWGQVRRDEMVYSKLPDAGDVVSDLRARIGRAVPKDAILEVVVCRALQSQAELQQRIESRKTWRKSARGVL
jgi:hypothetical protein